MTAIVVDPAASSPPSWLGADLDFLGPGKPADSTTMEASNSRFRQECPNEHWFLPLVDAQERVEEWRRALR